MTGHLCGEVKKGLVINRFCSRRPPATERHRQARIAIPDCSISSGCCRCCSFITESPTIWVGPMFGRCKCETTPHEACIKPPCHTMVLNRFILTEEWPYHMAFLPFRCSCCCAGSRYGRSETRCRYVGTSLCKIEPVRELTKIGWGQLYSDHINDPRTISTLRWSTDIKWQNP